ncbi:MULTISPECIES: hypothetical protein [unclassified Pseudomonas]|uniref:hypothetical protein n=1 Tax=unclassified Pseudomonas TaxID=196821 RepID=UPI0015AF9502|nr:MULTISPECIES: hypothetical protein [unclassified Pseudomonas]MCU1740016.1 hypothetical protein [Pseudomonas sp. 20S_6.2_Bac1]
MFNLLVKSSPWNEGRDTFWHSRVFEYTDTEIRTQFTINGMPNYQDLIKHPVLFLEETDRNRQQSGRVGRITHVRESGGDVIALEYYFDAAIPPIPQGDIIRLATLLGIPSTRWGPASISRTHWAVKNIDLFHLLLTQRSVSSRTPSLFNLPAAQEVDRDLLSAMMPFAGFNETWLAIQRVAAENGMRAGRADNIWEHHEIILDIVSLIDRSAIVICDCSGRNANVFYEIGIAHAFGKEVILITQHADDIPFDLAHLRNIRYLNNGEGIERLIVDLNARISTLRATI